MATLGDNEVFISGIGAYLPERRAAADAVRDGEYSESDWQKDGYEAICVSDLPGLDMAVAAARSALEMAGLPLDSVAAVLYSHIHQQGPALWSAASYLQRALEIEGASAVRLEQGCNGGMAALELAVRVVQADPRRAAVAATGDRFAHPDFDRWQGDYGIVYGDAGTAAVVSGQPGVARIRAIGSVTEPRLEEMHRGIGGSVEVVPGETYLRDRKKAFLSVCGGREYVTKMSRAAIEPLVERVLAESGVPRADIAMTILPNLGRSVVEPLYLPVLGIGYESSSWRFGRRTGHLGAGDMAAGLQQVTASRAVRSGDHVLLLGAGAGYSWSCAVVEIC